MADNMVTMIGNLTREPELRYTTGGHAVAKFGIAVAKKWKDRKGEWQEETTFLNVNAWRQLAENVAESFTVGARVIVSGHLVVQSWEDKDTGAKRTSVEIEADEIGASLKYATVAITKVARTPDAGQEHAG
jgi:single-strand DNA-binding protein